MTTALDVRDGDIIATQGFRCRVSGVRHIECDPDGGMIGLWHEESTGERVARYTLHSEPNAEYPRPLPTGYEGMNSGGNRRAGVTIFQPAFDVVPASEWLDWLLYDRGELVWSQAWQLRRGSQVFTVRAVPGRFSLECETWCDPPRQPEEDFYPLPIGVYRSLAAAIDAAGRYLYAPEVVRPAPVPALVLCVLSCDEIPF